MGNPPTRPDGTVTNATSPATPATAALAKPYGHDERMEAGYRLLDNHLPRTVTQRDQAKAAGAR
jgi:hypothetical protein